MFFALQSETDLTITVSEELLIITEQIGRLFSRTLNISDNQSTMRVSLLGHRRNIG